MIDLTPEITDGLLPATTVRIDVRAGLSGTGFFVAPGVLVTCKHVLKGVDTTDTEQAKKLAITGLDGTQYEIESLRHVSDVEEIDLAVLRVAPGREDVCALLVSGLNPGDEVHTFGYTKRHPEGIPTKLTAEGMNGNRTLFKLKGGQVEPGMSGSPVLNLRTGAVCGVLKRTRNRTKDLGGYSIPVTKLYELSESIIAGNRGVHVGSEWLDALPDQTRSGMPWQRAQSDSGRPGQAFVITVTQHEDRWEVSAELRPTDEDPIGPVVVDLNPVRVEITRLFRDWASPDLRWRGRVNRGEEVKLLGKILASAVLPGAVGERLGTLLAERGDTWLQVGLRFKDSSPDLEYLPWEHLYLPGDKYTGTGEVYLAREADIAFGRLRTSGPEQRPEPVNRRLSVLMVTARPPEGPAHQRAAYHTALGAVMAVASTAARAMRTNGLAVTELESPTLATLREHMERVQPDILHYVGYGRFKAGADEIALAQIGGTEFVSPEDFSEALQSCPPRAVVLQLSEVPTPEVVEVRADLTLFAPAVLGRGVEALVAYQYPTEAGYSECFNEHFYRRATTGTTVEMAVQSARQALYFAQPKERAFLEPTVTSRGPGGLLLATAEPEPEPSNYSGVARGYG